MSEYWDVDSILAEQEKMKCSMRITAFNLGYLDPASDPSGDLPEGTNMELPLWAARLLARRNYVGLELPKHYGERFRRNHLLADAASLNLNDKSPHYFQVGLQLALLFADEGLAPSLTQGFQGRYARILDRAENFDADDTSAYYRRISTEEQKLFDESRRASHGYEQWKRRQASKLLVSSCLPPSKRVRLRN